jgi:hypothetical protein
MSLVIPSSMLRGRSTRRGRDHEAYFYNLPDPGSIIVIVPVKTNSQLDELPVKPKPQPNPVTLGTIRIDRAAIDNGLIPGIL